ncbi:MAG TPA: UDP-N-acetylglucosamine 2-epimerase [Rhodanobacteraceae bacterium]|nr:UDP-N-acetylglucosamine 2-epimerase [Rhodanobacteraceae bacterium]
MTRPVVFVIGTRAQLIKVAPVVVECERQKLSCTLLMTGQHQETMQDLVDEFGIQSPQVHAIPASEHATLGSLLRWLPVAYRGVKKRLHEIGADSEGIDVLVHGDTLSTLIGAFAAHRSHARVVHLESGLSSGHLFDPFPEELCRRLVFRVTNLAMCPNKLAVGYMRRYPSARIVDTEGNTIVDAVALTGAQPAPCASRDGAYLVVSLHRFQNIYNKARLQGLVALIEALSREFAVHFVLHPATRRRLEKYALMQKLENAPGVKLSPRMGYGAFLRLAASAACVLTDGGSNQEELAALGLPTIIMRAHTERPDGLGANAIMEADATGGVERFVLGRKYLVLRQPSKINSTESPSKRIVHALRG